jgi:hypothetical protein
MQNSRGASEENRERVRGAAQFAFQQGEVEVAETAAAKFLGNVGGEVARLYALGTSPVRSTSAS